MSCAAWLAALVLLLYVHTTAAANLTLSNAHLSLSFSSADFSLTSLLSRMHNPPFEFLSAANPNWWSFTLVTNTSHYVVSSSFSHATLSSTSSPQTLLLFYEGLTLPASLGTVDLEVRVTLQADAQFAELRYSLRGVHTTEAAAVWDWTWSIDYLRSSSSTNSSDSDDVLVLNNSYGALYRRPLVTARSRIDEAYPSGGAAYQFLAYYHELNATAFPPTHPGLYFATHDASSARKVFSYVPSGTSVSLAVTVSPPNPATPQPQPDVSFPFVLGVFRGDHWDAAQLYRSAFALKAPWMARTIRQRRDWPQWWIDTHVWVNSGWQYHDVFNATQGDPVVVVDRVTRIQERFALPASAIALHWYVFQRSNTFDAFYPVYFPAKDGFGEAVSALQSAGVNVFPYVNGRIMDMDLPKWKTDDAQRFAAKSQPPQLFPDLDLYREDYGNNVTQSAMCPATSYWQSTYADVADTLVNTYGVHGIYVDQVCSIATPLPQSVCAVSTPVSADCSPRVCALRSGGSGGRSAVLRPHSRPRAGGMGPHGPPGTATSSRRCATAPETA